MKVGYTYNLITDGIAFKLTRRDKGPVINCGIFKSEKEMIDYLIQEIQLFQK